MVDNSRLTWLAKCVSVMMAVVTLRGYMDQGCIYGEVTELTHSLFK